MLDIIPSDGTPCKYCSRCKQWKPATPEFFQVDNCEEDGFRYICKACRSKRLANSIPEGQRQCTKCKKIYPATIDFFRKHSRGDLRPHCRKCEKEDYKIYNAAHTEDYNQWYQTNREKVLKAQRDHRKIHREEINEQQRQDYQSQHELHLAWSRAGGQKRRMHKKSIEGTLTAQQIQEKLKAQDYRCYYAACGHAKFEKRKDRTYIYHLDHTVPISRTDFAPRHDASYVVLTCPKCNLSKYNKLPHEWPQGGRLF